MAISLRSKSVKIEHEITASREHPGRYVAVVCVDGDLIVHGNLPSRRAAKECVDVTIRQVQILWPESDDEENVFAPVLGGEA
jgi:hypothetical protein